MNKLMLSILVLAAPVLAQDYVKYRDANQALECYIIQESDSAVVFQRMDNGEVNTAKLSELDYFISRTSGIHNITSREIYPDTTRVAAKTEPLNPDQRASLTIYAHNKSLSSDYGSRINELFYDPYGNLQIRSVDASQNGKESDMRIGGLMTIPASNNVSILLDLSYVSGKRSADENSWFYGFEEKLNGIAFGAAVKIYLSK
jgi:hypothetical protein